MIQWDLAEKLTAQGFSGIMWLPLFYDPDGDTPKNNPIQDKVDALNKKNGEVKPHSTEGEKPGKAAHRITLSKDDFSWMDSMKKEDIEKELYEVHDGKLVETFIPAWGDTDWLEAYNDNPDDWPAFDPTRYFCIGNNSQSNYWLVDLENKGAVVYFSHESSYNEHKNFSKVASSPEAFGKMIKHK
jgi:hypothetical protein